MWIRVGRRWEEISVTETETVAQLQDAFGSWVVHTALGGTGIPTGNRRSFFWWNLRELVGLVTFDIFLLFYTSAFILEQMWWRWCWKIFWRGLFNSCLKGTFFSASRSVSEHGLWRINCSVRRWNIRFFCFLRREGIWRKTPNCGLICNYPLVMTNIAIENDHRNSGFSHWKWWFYIVVLVYQRVVVNEQ